LKEFGRKLRSPGIVDLELRVIGGRTGKQLRAVGKDVEREWTVESKKAARGL